MSNVTERNVASLVAILQSQLVAWHARPVLQKAELEEIAKLLSDIPTGQTFLDYELLTGKSFHWAKPTGMLQSCDRDMSHIGGSGAGVYKIMLA